MKTLIIDNYDSFTYNLLHYVEKYTQEVEVWRNDAFKLEDVQAFDSIILSPGPGLPKDAGLMMDVIDLYHRSKNILGICLGHQALYEYFGGKLKNLKEVIHGEAVETYLYKNRSSIFDELPKTIQSGRYHSYVAHKEYLPEDLEIIASDIKGEIQGIIHKNYELLGLQFHPESILTDFGEQMIKNWLIKGK